MVAVSPGHRRQACRVEEPVTRLAVWPVCRITGWQTAWSGFGSFTTESPALDAGLVLAAIAGLRVANDAEGFVICDAVTGERIGNMALRHDGRTGEVSYWVAEHRHL